MTGKHPRPQQTGDGPGDSDGGASPSLRLDNLNLKSGMPVGPGGPVGARRTFNFKAAFRRDWAVIYYGMRPPRSEHSAHCGAQVRAIRPNLAPPLADQARGGLTLERFRFKRDLRNHRAIVQPRLYDCSKFSKSR